MRRSILLLALLAFTCLHVFAQTSTLSKQLTTYLNQFSLTEKAYLQFDKPYYAAGDTLYFKAYLTMGQRHQLSAISGVLHVDLISPQNKIYQSVKLQTINGLAWGDFVLPDSLARGNYRVRAYTNWMRNNGDADFFEQVIPVGSVLAAVSSSKSTDTRPDLQFFPEGGDMLTGAMGKVAFKAMAANGKGIDVSGIITDMEGKTVTAFKSSHNGMGAFMLNPKNGQQYKALVTYPNGTQSTVELPHANTCGIVLKIDNDTTQQARLQLIANDQYFAENKDKEVNVLIYSGGYATTLHLKLDSTNISLALLKKHLSPGIAVVTLFSSDGQPQSERLIFVQKPNEFSLALASDKQAYRTREKVMMDLHPQSSSDSTAIAHYSVAVINESKVPTDADAENSIYSYMLLTSELKGHIEQPGYYFNNVSAKTIADLDLVMLTHGYRRFEWKHLTDLKQPPVTYQPERGIEISGRVKNWGGKPTANSTVTLIPRGAQPITGHADSIGNFKFKDLVFTDTANFIIQALKKSGDDATEIKYYGAVKSPALQQVVTSTGSQDVNQLMTTYLANSAQQHRLDSLKLLKGRMLKEVKIRAIRNSNNYRSSSPTGPGHADQVIHMDDVKTVGFLGTVLQGRLVGLEITDDMVLFFKKPMAIYLDGVEFAGSLKDIPTETIETVEVFKFASASIYGMNGGNGVIALTSWQGKGRQAKDIVARGVLPITVPGFYKAREFYAPKYEAKSSTIPDLRSTIYWQPELTTDAKGNASFNYYNADGTGTYRVIVEGIDEAGHIGRAVYRYAVK
ncbi:TonB-dependent receptor plug domain-containing protein [Mucilaginibacter sp. R11]|uniref:TonB-dependent receptor plug domain-containing protein n=2 Tax=Mucilaginibacter agri TaxID=2695265 RepID=A0A966DVC1_9SPHI|nr:TonB-dependent receptor plug domain-containing protein [Mucilaginibacter agri]